MSNNLLPQKINLTFYPAAYCLIMTDILVHLKYLLFRLSVMALGPLVSILRSWQFGKLLNENTKSRHANYGGA